MKFCETCRWWNEIKISNAKRWGYCTAVKETLRNPEASGNLAWIDVDKFESPAISCRPDFGCVLHEEKSS